MSDIQEQVEQFRNKWIPRKLKGGVTQNFDAMGAADFNDEHNALIHFVVEECCVAADRYDAVFDNNPSDSIRQHFPWLDNRPTVGRRGG